MTVYFYVEGLPILLLPKALWHVCMTVRRRPLFYRNYAVGFLQAAGYVAYFIPTNQMHAVPPPWIEWLGWAWLYFCCKDRIPDSGIALWMKMQCRGAKVSGTYIMI